MGRIGIVVFSVIALLSLSIGSEAFSRVHASSTSPSIVGSSVNPGSNSVTIQGGGSTYVYAATEGGAFNINPTSFTLDLGVTNGQGLTSVLIGHSSTNVGSYNPNGALFPIIGGIGVTGSYSSTFSFKNAGTTSLSGFFFLTSSALVVLASASSNNAPLLSISPLFTPDSSGSTSCCSTVAFAHASLSAGFYSVSVNYAACSPPCTTDPTSMAIGLVLFAFYNNAPQFQLEVTPSDQTVALTGSAGYHVHVVPQSGFSSPIVVTLSGLPNGVSASCSSFCFTIPGNVLTFALSAPSYQADITLTANNQVKINTYPLTLTANPIGSTPITTNLNLVVTKLIGLENTVSISDYKVLSSDPSCFPDVWINSDVKECFSIQQNFLIASTSSSDPAYFVQNALQIARNTSGQTHVEPQVNIFRVSLFGCAYFTPVKIQNRHGNDLFPSTLTTHVVTSVINGASLDFSADGETFSYALPSASYYVTSLGKSCGQYQPQLDVVGGAGGALATFGNPTDFTVQSLVQLASQPSIWTGNVVQTILHTIPIGESSMNLRWALPSSTSPTSSLVTTVSYENGARDQGVAYVPGPVA